jgi:ABC-type transport system involved in multi-copper enzyme maturation permease subunit
MRVSKLLAIINYTVKEHIRHRLYLGIFIFGLLLIGGSLIVSSLAVDEKLRLVLDLGLAGIEFVALFAVVFVTVGLILEEMESRTVYLILSRPVDRWKYVLGRYLGTFLSVALGMVVMAILHLMVLFLHGWQWANFYPVAVFCSIGKIAFVSSLALFISLISTSTASSMTMTAFLWVMGHFTSEIKFLGEKSASPIVKGIAWVFYHVTPDFSVFNYRDFFSAALQPSESWFVWLLFYSLCYCGTALFLSCWIFSKREF